MIVYKCLRSDSALSQHQQWRWPLPDDDGEPGVWVEEDVTPVICQAGLHGYLTLEQAKAQGTDYYDIYEMELEGNIVQGTGPHNNKACGTKARLLRKVWDRNGEVIRLADLVWQ